MVFNLDNRAHQHCCFCLTTQCNLSPIMGFHMVHYCLNIISQSTLILHLFIFHLRFIFSCQIEQNNAISCYTQLTLLVCSIFKRNIPQAGSGGHHHHVVTCVPGWPLIGLYIPRESPSVRHQVIGTKQKVAHLLWLGLHLSCQQPSTWLSSLTSFCY